MDAPLASKVVQGFCEGFEKQVKEGKKEAEEIVNVIDFDALKALCTRYDNETGTYPQHKHEGAAVLEFFEKLKADVEKRKEKEEKRTL